MQITFAFYILSFGIFGKNRNFARAKPRFFLREYHGCARSTVVKKNNLVHFELYS